MATAYKCDRCGKLFDKHPVDYLFKDKTIYTKGLYIIHVETIPDANSHSLDLCFDCYNKLRDFLEGEKDELLKSSKEI